MVNSVDSRAHSKGRDGQGGQYCSGECEGLERLLAKGGRIQIYGGFVESREEAWWHRVLTRVCRRVPEIPRDQANGEDTATMEVKEVNMEIRIRILRLGMRFLEG